MRPSSGRALFGGALSLRLPASWVNAADIRPEVPDNQEVFLADDEDGVSLIVELLEPAGATAEEAAVTVLQDAGDDAATVTLPPRPLGADAVPLVGGTPGAVAVALEGSLSMQVGGHPVLVRLGLLRLPPPVATDVALSLNDGRRPPVAAGTQRPLSPIFRDALASLTVHDWGLFGGGDG
jgi:hypothetical protein